MTELPSWVVPAAGAAAVIGALGTIIGLLGAGGDEAWWMLLVSFLFWGGLAQGLVMWCAILRTCQSTWAAGVNRLGRSAVNFLPFSWLLFLVLYIGRYHWLTWLTKPVPEKAKWLNAPFFFGRDAGLLVLITLLSYLLVAWYRQGDTAAGDEAEAAIRNRVNKLSLVLVIVYAAVYTIFAFDLIMSLAPHWYSTLFGAYYFIGNLYMSMAALIIIAALLRGPMGLTEHLGPDRFADMGNLLMGFGMFFTGLMFAQWLTIWYGDLPEEITFLIPRMYQAPWLWVGSALIVMVFLGPFILLQSGASKTSPGRLSMIALLVFAGMWLERCLLVVPTFAPNRLAGLFSPFAWATNLMCLGVLVLVIVSSLRGYPQVSRLDSSLTLD